MNKFEIKSIRQSHKQYPRILKEIFDPPEVLYYIGSLGALESPCIAVVGSRKVTRYGEQATKEIVRDLITAGVTVVSGLALGIDSVAHQAAIKNNGKTVAVLANGLDKIYPASHANIARAIIAKGGALISEYPPKTPTYPANFPVRNRIVVGLCLGTVIIEATIRSGTLISARLALENNREVFVVPHNIFNQTGAGPNWLIQNGATLIQSGQDILSALNIASDVNNPSAQRSDLSSDELRLLELLGKGPLAADELGEQLGIVSSRLNSLLTEMEIKGLVASKGNALYESVIKSILS